MRAEGTPSSAADPLHPSAPPPPPPNVPLPPPSHPPLPSHPPSSGTLPISSVLGELRREDEAGDSGEEDELDQRAAEPAHSEEERKVLSDAGMDRGPLTPFVHQARGQRGGVAGSGPAQPRPARVALQAYDAYVMVFHNRPGSYYCTSSKYPDSRVSPRSR